MRAPEEQRAFMREYMKNYNHGVTLGLRRRHPTCYLNIPDISFT